MANSIIYYNGNGSQTQYALNFTLGILSRDHVKCQVDGEVDGLGDPVYRTLEWITDGLVNIQGTAPTVGVKNIVFTRTIPVDELIHDYENGALIEESNLDDSNKQSLMAMHEVLDGRFTAALQNDLDMGGNKITNLAPGTEPDDAATYGQIGDAPGYAEDAEASADAALVSQGAAATSATNAFNSAALAADWASKTNGIVAATDYSAKAWAIGGTNVTGTATRGSAKDWAVSATSPDGTSDKSAKSYAADAAAAVGTVKVTAADTTSAVLNSTLIGTANDITFTVTNPGANETLVAATGSNIPKLNAAANSFTGTTLELSNAASPLIRVVDTTNSVTTAIQSADTSGSIGTVSNHQLGLFTNNVTRVAIDNAGRVTMPYQPMFSAYRDAGNLTTSGDIVYNGELFDVGSNFNTATGFFTAPVTGTYEFDVYHQTNGTTSSNAYIRMNKNGGIYRLFECNANTLGSVFGKVKMQLAAGDTVNCVLIIVSSTMLLYTGSQSYNGFEGKLIA